ncbi:MAG: DNA polymerase III subunit gamma/tau [Deltaproteobacteria bacterium]
MPDYLVLARKWRPGLFDEVVGQAHVTRTLKNAIALNKVGHAYLFSGSRGVGKTTTARILAKALNCEKGPTTEPCNECSSCRAIAAGSSVDVFEIDGASNTGVENVQELREGVAYLPSQGRHKVYIIDEVHMLSNHAFNALLKTIEEPPSHAVFIFATTEPHKIPQTIRSRCQCFDFRRIPLKEIQRHLVKILEGEGVGFDEEALFVVSREAEGSLRDAQSLLDQVLAYSGGKVKTSDVFDALGLMDRAVLFDLAGAVIEKDGKLALNIVEKIYDFGYDLKKVSASLLELIRDLTVVKVTGNAELLDLPDSEIERAVSIASKAGVLRLQMLFSIISRGYEEILRSAYPRYAFEMALMKAAHFDEIEPVAELIERLERLKKGESAGRQPPLNPPLVKGGTHESPPFSKGSTHESPSFSKGGLGGVAPVKAAQPVSATATPLCPPLLRGDDMGVAHGDSSPADEAGLMAHLKKNMPSLAGPLDGAILKIEGNTVEINAGVDHRKLFEEIKREQIEKFASLFLKRPVRLRVNAGDQGGVQAANLNPQAAGNDIGKDALSTLGARIIEDATGRLNV